MSNHAVELPGLIEFVGLIGLVECKSLVLSGQKRRGIGDARGKLTFECD